MSEPQIEKKAELAASPSEKAYHKSNEKSRKEQGKNGATARKQRWQKAAEAMPLSELLEHLKLKDAGAPVCPYCGGKDCLEIDATAGQFHCRGCGKKGTGVSLVKKVKGLSNWQAIAYLEELTATSSAPEVTPEAKATSEPISAIPDADGFRESGEKKISCPPRVILTGPVIASSQANQAAPPPEENPTQVPRPGDAQETSLSQALELAETVDAGPGAQRPTPPSSPSLPASQPAAVETKAGAYRSGRIPEEEIERIKREVDLAELVRRSGVTLRRQGKDLIGLCPFHNDTSPSLVISPDKNLWHCLGACDDGGSTIDWVMKQRGVGCRDAMEILLAEFPALGSITHIAERVPAGPGAAHALSGEGQELLKQVIAHYYCRLRQSPEALAYLDKRGIKDRELIEHFRIGFVDRSLPGLLPSTACREGQEMRDRLREIGVLRETGHELFRGCVVVPIISEQGMITEVYGRKIRATIYDGKEYNHFYLPGAHQGIFNPTALRSESVILCEAIIDALTFWKHGIRNVTAGYGANGFSEELIAALFANRVKRVYHAQDNDPAGNQSAERIAKKLMAKGIECYRLPLPDKLDVNEFACRYAPADENLRRLLTMATPMGNSAVGPAIRSSAPDNFFNLVAGKPATKPQNGGENAGPSSPADQVAPDKILLDYHKKGEDIEIAVSDRLYRVRGLAKNLSFDVMKVNVRVSIADRFHIDTLELYNARQRIGYAKLAAIELGVKSEQIRHDLGRILFTLEEIQSRNIESSVKPEAKPVMTEKERQEALEFLQDPHLMERIAEDFKRCGLVGEDLNAQCGYVGAVSRQLDDPLHFIIQSSSAAGKTSLLDMILLFIPEEDKVKYTAMTGQSLFYMQENELAHKTLAISEEKGAEEAIYAIKIMQSEKQLHIASTGKNPKSGRLVTNQYRVNGPVQSMLSTTAENVDEEVKNRALILTANEDRDQTRAIQEAQRESETLEGLRQKYRREQIIKRHHNAQRLLRRIHVVNPYATELTFLDTQLRTRRDHKKYLVLIRAVALLYQYQRPIKHFEHDGKKVAYIEATPQDIAIANRMACHMMGTSLDELAPQTRRLLEFICRMVDEHCRKNCCEQGGYLFTRRDVRQYTAWGDTQLKIHLLRLVELEYILVRFGGHKQRYFYELAYRGEGEGGKSFIMGLLDVNKLRRNNQTLSTMKTGRGKSKTGRG